jgi:tetratricopeptide (TPR) repeat protein
LTLWPPIFSAAWLGAVACSLVLASAPASAQPTAAGASGSSAEAARDKQARQRFERGRAAFDRGDYRAAWSEFHEAYRLSGRAQLLYNIGQTADRLGYDSDALKAFRLYLERLPAAENRREVENRVRALEQRVQDSERAPPPPGSAAAQEQGAWLENLETLPDEAPANSPGSPPSAAGAPPAAPPPPPPPAASLSEGPRPTRAGLYLRLGLGFGLRRDGLSGTAAGTLSGAGFAGELAIATTLFPGFVLGGAIYSDLASSPTYELERTEAELGSAHLNMFGVMGDWYLQPSQNGLHAQAALCFAVLNVDYADNRVALGRNASGIGAVLGVGYEWPIAREVGIGVLGRVSVASLADQSRSHGVFAPSLLASLTWY